MVGYFCSSTIRSIGYAQEQATRHRPPRWPLGIQNHVRGGRAGGHGQFDGQSRFQEQLQPHRRRRGLIGERGRPQTLGRRRLSPNWHRQSAASAANSGREEVAFT